MAGGRAGVFAVLLLLYTAGQAIAEGRLALLVGNADYSAKVGPLNYPLRDVDLVGAALLQLGFEVTKLTNATKAQMDEAFHRYVDRVRRSGPNAISFFYYSGHGAVNPDTNINYLIPVDIEKADTSDLWYHSIEQQAFIDLLSQRARNATHFVVFDACRSELNLGAPGKSLAAEKGFAPVSDVSGILIAYATAQKRTAADTGVFAKILSEELVKPGVEAFAVFREVQVRVEEAMHQEPWMSLNYIPRIYLAAPPKPGEPSSPVPAPLQSPLSEAAQTWTQIKDLKNPAVFEAFRKKYGSSSPVYDALAEQRLDALKRPQRALAKPGLEDKQAAGGSARLVRVFEGNYRHAAFSPDGKYAVASDVHGTLTFWDLTSGLEVRTIEADKGSIVALAYAPDGQTLLTGTSDGSVKTWSAATGQLLGTIHSGLTLTSLVALPDGRIAAGGCETAPDGRPVCRTNRTFIKIFGSGDAVASTSFETGKTLNAFAVTKDNKRALTCGDKLQIWDFAAGTRLHSLSSLYCNTIQVSQDGRHAIAGGAWGSLKLFSTDIATGREVQSFGANEINVHSVALTPDGRFALSGSGGLNPNKLTGPISERRNVGQAILWDTTPGKKIATLDEINDYIWLVAFSPDGRFALSAGGDGLKIWDVSEWTAPQTARQ